MAGPTLKGVAVGAGYFSRFHLDAWRRLPGVELAALCDVDAGRAADRCREFGIPRHYADFAVMLEAERPDFADVITRPATHLALVAEAAQRGVAVICQKPLADTAAEAAQIVELATAAGVPFMVHENFRFQPWHREIKSLLAAGAVGRPLSIALRCRTGDGWRENAYLDRQPYFRAMPRLLIHETGVHFLDTFRYLFGEVERVYAELRRLNPHIAGEDTGRVLLTFACGASGLIDATRYHESDAADPRYTFGEFLIDGDDGTIRLDPDGGLTVKPLGRPARRHDYRPPRGGFAGDCVLATQRHFAERLRGGGPFETNGPDYLRTLAVQEAVYRSAETGRPAPVGGPTP